MFENDRHLLLKNTYENTFTEQQKNIFNVLVRGLPVCTPELAAEIAYEFDYCCPPVQNESMRDIGNAGNVEDGWDEADDGEAMEIYLDAIWEVMIHTAHDPDTTSEIHISLVKILEELRGHAKGDIKFYGTQRRLWRDLPYFPEALDTYFDDSTTEHCIADQGWDLKIAQKWLNFTAFEARCLGAGVTGPYPHAMRAIRPGLEEELTLGDATSPTETRLKAACLWITHAAKPLLWWAQENIGYTDVPQEDESQYIEGGSLYHGPPAMCLRRWGFWLSRLEELGKEDAISEDARTIVLEAAEHMRTIERTVGHSLLGPQNLIKS